MSKKYKVGLAIGVALVAVAGAFSYIYSRRASIDVLNPKGPIAAQERHLIFFGLALSLIVVIPVFAMAIMIGWRYRETNTKAKYEPDWDRSRLAEVVWWGVPTLLISILSVVAWNSSHTLDPSRPINGSAPTINVQVVALDWKWLFIYPQQHIASVNLVQFPENAPVNFQITSDAPMNSFWIPQLGGQIYAMPGMDTQLHLLASTTGDFYGSSANISGRGFADMHFIARASSAADFYKWVAQAKQSPNHLDFAAYGHLAQPSVNNQQTTFALADGNLFNDVLSKYMAPGSIDGMDMQMAGMN
jgi:cytochrome o ubiquinol oxidase subunit 2